MTIYLALSNGDHFGWGVCGKYLRKELGKLADIEEVQEGNVDGVVVHTIRETTFEPLYKVRGAVNVGYTFFENELTDVHIQNAKQYDLILAGSTWCYDKLKAAGIDHCDILFQGVDPELFYPITERKTKENFVIFSGGKFEYRKGQDIVIAAFKELRKYYKDMRLITAWHNPWINSVHTMLQSSLIDIDHIWDGDFTGVEDLPIMDQAKFRGLVFKRTDIGLFPNRCEGGTNLVMMEYMACGKPVIASYTSGHKDMLYGYVNSLPIKGLDELKLYDKDKLVMDWEEPSVEKVIWLLKYAYRNRETIELLGRAAGAQMKNYTWKDTAEKLFNIIRTM